MKPCAIVSFPTVSSPRVSPLHTIIQLKSLSEESNMCMTHSKECKEAWIKHGMLMDVRDEELVQ